MSTYRIRLLLLLALNSYGMLAQDTDTLTLKREASENFLETMEALTDGTTLSGTSWFDYHSSIKKPYLFNGNFIFPYTFGGPSLITGSKRSLFQAIQFSPEVRIRLFQNDPVYGDKSKPVRTPSYVPKITYYLTHYKWWNKSLNKRFYAGLSALHHSNGEDGWEFTYNADSVVNIYDGSFSESLYFQLFGGGNLEHLKPAAAKQKNYHRKLLSPKRRHDYLELAVEQRHRLNWKAGIEMHPRYFANQKFYESRLYGGNRVFFQLIHQHSVRYQTLKKINGTPQASGSPIWREKWRLVVQGEYITDLTYDEGSLVNHTPIAFGAVQKRLNLWFTAYRHLLKTQYLALFFQTGYFGSDNYNIYFQFSNFIVRGGIAFVLFEE